MGQVDYVERFEAGREEFLSELERLLLSDIATQDVASKRYPLIVSDIEGCLNLDPHHYDFEIIDRLRRLNSVATPSNALPQITLCTGRQAPYVDAFSAFLGVQLPIIFEGGSGLFFPTKMPGKDRVAWHPLIERAIQSGEYAQIERIVSSVVEREAASPSLGKEKLQTFHARPGQDIEELSEIFRRELSELGDAVNVTHSANAVDITVGGVDKGSAITWLLESLDQNGNGRISSDDLVAIGDAPNDLALLKAVGRSVAPANASVSVKAVVTHASMYTDAKCVAEEFIRCVDLNRNR